MKDENTFKDIYDIVVGIGETWGSLTDIARADVLETLGGKRGVNQLAAVLNNVDRVKDIYQTSLNSKGSAEEEEKAYERSVQYSINQTKAQLQQLASDFLSSDLLKGIIDAANQFLGIVDQIVSSLGTVKTSLLALSAMSIFKGTVLKDKNALVPMLFKDLVGIADRNNLQSQILNDLGGNHKPTTAINLVSNLGNADNAASILNGISGLNHDQKKYLLDEAFKNAADGAHELALAMNEPIKNFSLMSKGTKIVDNIKKAFTGLGSIIQTAFSPANLIFTLPAIGVAAIAGVVAYRKKVQQDLIDNGKKGASEFSEDQSTLAGYVERYKELSEKLKDENLSSEEQVSIKQQLLALQQEIVNQYGAAASGINLANGELNTQLAILTEISKKQAEINLDKHLNEYKEAVKQTSDPDSSIDLFPGDFNSDFRRKVKNYVDKVGGMIYREADEIHPWDHIEFEEGVDVSEASKKFKEIYELAQKDYADYQKEYESSGIKDPTMSNLESFIESVKLDFEEFDKTADNYQEQVEAAISAVVDYVGGSEVATMLKKASTNLTEALLSGDDDVIDKAISNYQEYYRAYNDEIQKAMDSTFAEDLGLDVYRFVSQRNQLTSSFDENMLKQQFMTEIIRDTDDALLQTTATMAELSKVSNNNPFKSLEQAQDIKKNANIIKEAGLDIVDIQTMLSNGRSAPTGDLVAETNEVEDAVFSLASAFGIATDDAASLSSFLTALTNSGVITSDSLNEVNNTLGDTITKITTASSHVADLTAILSESAGATGVTLEHLETFKSIFGDDANKAIEYTANGIHLNQEALLDLQKEYSAKTKSNYLSELSKQLIELSRLNKEIKVKDQTGEDTFGLKSQRDAIRDNIRQLREAYAEYQGAMSDFNLWTQAKNSGSERGMYQDAFGAFEEYEEQLKLGWTDNGLREWIHMMTGMEDAATASYSEIVEQFKGMKDTLSGTSFSLMDFYDSKDGKVSKKGISNFFKGVNEAFGENFAKLGENGWEFDFSDANIQRMVSEWGIGPELIEIIARAAVAAGAHGQFGDELLGYGAKEAIADRNTLGYATGKDYTFMHFNPDEANFDSINEAIENTTRFLENAEEMGADQSTIEAGTRYLQYLNDLLAGINPELTKAEREETSEERVLREEQEEEARVAEQKALEEQAAKEEAFNDNIQKLITALETLNKTLTEEKEEEEITQEEQAIDLAVGKQKLNQWDSDIVTFIDALTGVFDPNSDEAIDASLALEDAKEKLVSIWNKWTKKQDPTEWSADDANELGEEGKGYSIFEKALAFLGFTPKTNEESQTTDTVDVQTDTVNVEGSTQGEEQGGSQKPDLSYGNPIGSSGASPEYIVAQTLADIFPNNPSLISDNGAGFSPYALEIAKSFVGAGGTLEGLLNGQFPSKEFDFSEILREMFANYNPTPEEPESPASVEVEADNVEVNGSAEGGASEGGSGIPNYSGDKKTPVIGEVPNYSEGKKNPIVDLSDDTEDLGDSASSSEKDINGATDALENLGVTAQQTAERGQELAQSISPEDPNAPLYDLDTYLQSYKVRPGMEGLSESDILQMAQFDYDHQIEIPVEYRPETEEIDAANEVYASTPVEQQVEMVMTTETNTTETPEPTNVDGGTVTMNTDLNTDGFQQKVDEIYAALEQLEPKEETVEADVKGKPDVDALAVAIDQVHGKSVNVVANPDGLEGVQTLRREIDLLPPTKTITITTIQQTINKGTANPSGGGTKKLDGTAHAQGTAHAGGKWGLEQDEDNALVNELGTEIVVILL